MAVFMTPSDETLDALFHGRLTLYQSRTGYRFSLDALLLAHFVTVKRAARVVDLGTGNGVIPLVLADLYPSISLTGVELQSMMAERARRNVDRNGLEARIQIVCADVRSFGDTSARETFDTVISNPPYRKPTSGRLSFNDERQIARHEMQGNLNDFIRGGVLLLRRKGNLAVIYPAIRSLELLTVMRQAGVEPKRLRMVHSFVSAEASLVLVEGVKDGRSGLKVLPPLIIYRAGKQYSDELESIIAGSRERRARSFSLRIPESD